MISNNFFITILLSNLLCMIEMAMPSLHVKTTLIPGNVYSICFNLLQLGYHFNESMCV